VNRQIGIKNLKYVGTICYLRFLLPANNICPACFFLMTRKTKDLYIAAFEKLQLLLHDFEPVQIMAHVEDASILAFKEVYGQNMVAEGC